MSPTKIDVREFVTWILAQPLAVRMHLPRPAVAAEAASRLWHAASDLEHADDARKLALDIYTLPLRLSTRRKSGTMQECLDFLDSFGLYLDKDRCKMIAGELKASSLSKARGVIGTYVEYRSADGRVFGYRMNPNRRKWPGDDLGRRLSIGYQALKRSQCPTAYSVLIELLSFRHGTHWTPQLIRSRIKPFESELPLQWPCVWLEGFWRFLDSSNVDNELPEEMPLELVWIPIDRSNKLKQRSLADA